MEEEIKILNVLFIFKTFLSDIILWYTSFVFQFPSLGKQG